MMTEQQTFRSAFNGFHREDVVNHIAYMTNRYEAQLNQVRAENETLRTELEQIQDQAREKAADEARIEELMQALADQDADMASLREELALANQLLNEQAEQLDAMRDQLAEAKEAASKPVAIEKSANHWDELRAYRRAETVERQARDRVNEMYDSATAALGSAGSTLSTAGTAFEELAERFRADLVALMETVDSGSSALHTAAKTLNSLRPRETE